MTDPIKAMLEAGWTHDEFMSNVSTSNCETKDILVFSRPKQKPNAYVDFEKLNKAMEEIAVGYWNNKEMKVDAALTKGMDLLRECIKKVEG